MAATMPAELPPRASDAGPEEEPMDAWDCLYEANRCIERAMEETWNRTRWMAKTREWLDKVEACKEGPPEMPRLEPITRRCVALSAPEFVSVEETNDLG